MSIAVVGAILFASLSGIAWGQVPINPQNRIVGGKIYNPRSSPLWMDIRTNLTERLSSLKVQSIGRTSIACDVFGQVLDDGGRWGVFHVIGEDYVKTILIFNHPAHDEMTTGTVLYNFIGPCPNPFLSMRIANWRTNGLVLEAYDCGMPDTPENRKKAGIPIPTTKQSAAAQEEIAAGLKAAEQEKRVVEERKLAAQQQASESAVSKRQAADAEIAARLKAIEQVKRLAEEKQRAAQQQAVEAAIAKKQAPYARALKWNMENAEKGDAYGLLRMGQRYRDGEGVQKDVAKAREYFTKAIQAGSPSADAELSTLNRASTNTSLTR